MNTAVITGGGGGLNRGCAVIPVGRVAWLSWWLSRLAPGLYERQMVTSISGESS